MYRYFAGKRRTEEALLDCYRNKTGVVLRPGFIFGTRTVPLPTTGFLPSHFKVLTSFNCQALR